MVEIFGVFVAGRGDDGGAVAKGRHRVVISRAVALFFACCFTLKVW